MRKINEILRLRAQGMSVADIATSVGAGRTTVYEYLARAESAGIGWPLPDGVDQETLEEKLFPPPSAELAARRPVPEWRQVHRDLKRNKHVTLRLVWLEWRENNPDGWGYSQFCWHYQQWLAGQDVVMRLSYVAGERMFVDFSGDTTSWVDPESGEVHKAEVFVAVLGCSGMLYAEATRGQDLGSWTTAHMNAWADFSSRSPSTVNTPAQLSTRDSPSTSVASAAIVPGDPSGKTTTNNRRPLHRLNPVASNGRPNNGCSIEVTRTSHGNTARSCCSLSRSRSPLCKHETSA